MKSLQEKVKKEGMTEEERCDVLFSMLQRIEDGAPIGDCPEEVLLDENNQLQAPLKGKLLNMAYWPPEMIENPAMRAGKPQRWFALGMFAHYMYYKTDFYTRKNTAVLALRPMQHVIMPGDVAEIPFGVAVSALTAVDPGKRQVGLTKFLQYLQEKMKGTAQVRYLLNGNVVGSQTFNLTSDIEDQWPSGRLMINKTMYRLLEMPLKIPYRPGTHTYHVPVALDGPLSGGQAYIPMAAPGLYLYQAPVTQMGQYTSRGREQVLSLNHVDSENQIKTSMGSVRLDICKLTAGVPPMVSRPLGHIDIEKPADYRGGSYLIKLRYSAGTKCVGIQLASETGVAIAPARSVSMESMQ